MRTAAKVSSQRWDLILLSALIYQGSSGHPMELKFSVALMIGLTRLECSRKLRTVNHGESYAWPLDCSRDFAVADPAWRLMDSLRWDRF